MSYTKITYSLIPLIPILQNIMPSPLKAFSKSKIKSLSLIFLILSFNGCKITPKLRDQSNTQYKPDQARIINNQTNDNELPSSPFSDPINLSVNNTWIFEHIPKPAIKLITTAEKNNRNIQQAKELYYIAQQQFRTNSNFLLPSGSLSAAKNINISDDAVTSGSAFNFNTSWNINLWNDLDITQRSNILSLRTAELSFQNTIVSTISNVLNQWITLSVQQQNLELDREQLALLKQLHKATKNGYLRSINTIEEVISFQNNIDLSSEALGQSLQSYNRQIRNLQLALGQYPNSQMNFGNYQLTIKPLSVSLPKNFPAQLVARRPDIKQQWYSLLQSDLNLAIAHRNRFPSLSLSISSNISSNQVKRLFDKENLLSSITGNATLPLLRRGDLKRAENQAQSQVKIAELSYIDTTYNAFLEVEQLFENEISLYQRYHNLNISKQNVSQAESIEIKKYLNRNSSFLEVINAQETALNLRRQFNNLKREILLNRLALYIAMGGNFKLEPNNQPRNELSSNE